MWEYYVFFYVIGVFKRKVSNVIVNVKVFNVFGVFLNSLNNFLF